MYDNEIYENSRHSFGSVCDPDYNDDGVIGLPDFNVLRSYLGGAPGPAGALP